MRDKVRLGRISPRPDPLQFAIQSVEIVDLCAEENGDTIPTYRRSVRLILTILLQPGPSSHKHLDYLQVKQRWHVVEDVDR